MRYNSARPRDQEIATPKDRECTKPRDREIARPRDHETARPRDHETARPRDHETARPPITKQILVKKMLQHRAKVAEKVGAKNLKIVKKMGTKNIQNGGPNLSKSSPEGPKREPGSQNPKERQDPTTTNDVCGRVGFFNEKVANMIPSSNQNRRKIDAKMDERNDASWNQNGRMLAPKSNKNEPTMALGLRGAVK